MRIGIELALVQLGPAIGLNSSSVTDEIEEVGILIKLSRFIMEVVVGLGRSESCYVHTAIIEY